MGCRGIVWGETGEGGSRGIGRNKGNRKLGGWGNGGARKRGWGRGVVRASRTKEDETREQARSGRDCGGESGWGFWAVRGIGGGEGEGEGGIEGWGGVAWIGGNRVGSWEEGGVAGIGGSQEGRELEGGGGWG